MTSLPQLTLAARAMLRDQALDDNERAAAALVADGNSFLGEDLEKLEACIAALTPEEVALLAVADMDQCPPQVRQANHMVGHFMDEMYCALLNGPQGTA